MRERPPRIFCTLPIRARLLTLLMATLCAIISGCSSDEEPDPPPAQSATPASSQPADSPEVVEPGPDESLRMLIADFRTRPELVWETLPASYQETLQTQHEQFTRRVDPAAWERFVRIVDEVATLLDKHGADILDAQEGKPIPVLGEMNQAQLTYLHGLLKTVSSPPFGDLEKLQQEELGQLWLSLAPPLFAVDSLPANAIVEVQSDPLADSSATPILIDYFSRLSRVEVSLISHEGDKAVLKLVDPQVPDEPTEIEFVRHEEKWIPLSWRENWSLWMGRLKLVLDQAANYLNGFALVQTKQLQELEDRLVALNQIEDQQAFTTAWHAAVADLQTRLPRVAAFSTTTNINGAGESKPERKPISEIDLQSEATIIISKAMSAAEQARIAPQILGLSQYAEVATLLPPEVKSDQTRFRLIPVPDLQAIAENVDFGEVEKVDEEKNEIWISLTATESE